MLVRGITPQLYKTTLFLKRKNNEIKFLLCFNNYVATKQFKPQFDTHPVFHIIFRTININKSFRNVEGFFNQKEHWIFSRKRLHDHFMKKFHLPSRS